MKILFWNIGDDPTAAQLTFVENSIAHIDADVACLAEGAPTEPKCVTLVNSIKGGGYNSFYDPTFYSGPSISNQYGYRKLGLKVFEKPVSYKTGPFTFADQAVDGRVVYYRFKFNNESYSCFFIHNRSLAGDHISQGDFMFQLRLTINAKTINHKKDKVFIIGDFNLEPWDKLLHHNRTIKSYFSTKRFQFYSTRGGKNKFFNPFYEYMQSNVNANLQGTFNTISHNSLIDFGLFSGGMTNYMIDILHSINGQSLLIQNNTRLTLLHGFDHLPILITIN